MFSITDIVSASKIKLPFRKALIFSAEKISLKKARVITISVSVCECGRESLCILKNFYKKISTHRLVSTSFWLRQTHLNLQRPSCGAQSSLRLGAPMNFDRYASSALTSLIVFPQEKSSSLRCASSPQKAFELFGDPG